MEKLNVYMLRDTKLLNILFWAGVRIHPTRDGAGNWRGYDLFFPEETSFYDERHIQHSESYIEYKEAWKIRLPVLEHATAFPLLWYGRADMPETGDFSLLELYTKQPIKAALPFWYLGQYNDGVYTDVETHEYRCNCCGIRTPWKVGIVKNAKEIEHTPTCVWNLEFYTMEDL